MYTQVTVARDRGSGRVAMYHRVMRRVKGSSRPSSGSASTARPLDKRGRDEPGNLQLLDAAVKLATG
jgi:hypothetical protein